MGFEIDVFFLYFVNEPLRKSRTINRQDLFYTLFVIVELLQGFMNIHRHAIFPAFFGIFRFLISPV